MKKLLLLAAVVLLVAAAPAAAGGWATVKLSSTPAGLTAGDMWTVEITVLQHGQTPLAGLKPKVTIRNGKAGTRSVVAKPTARLGVYRARIRFPVSGLWRYEVWDGFVEYNGARTHRFPAVRIAA